jgi:hypothetical protein
MGRGLAVRAQSLKAWYFLTIARASGPICASVRSFCIYGLSVSQVMESAFYPSRWALNMRPFSHSKYSHNMRCERLDWKRSSITSSSLVLLRAAFCWDSGRRASLRDRPKPEQWQYRQFSFVSNCSHRVRICLLLIFIVTLSTVMSPLWDALESTQKLSRPSTIRRELGPLALSSIVTAPDSTVQSNEVTVAELPPLPINLQASTFHQNVLPGKIVQCLGLMQPPF